MSIDAVNIVRARACLTKAVAEKTWNTRVVTAQGELVALYQDAAYSGSQIVDDFYSADNFQRHQRPLVRAQFPSFFGLCGILGEQQRSSAALTVWYNTTLTFVSRSLQRMASLMNDGGNARSGFIFLEGTAIAPKRAAIFGSKKFISNS